jgi:hypothetical protein
MAKNAILKLRVDEELRQALQARARYECRSVSNLVEWALTQYLVKRGALPDLPEGGYNFDTEADVILPEFRRCEFGHCSKYSHPPYSDSPPKDSTEAILLRRKVEVAGG